MGVQRLGAASMAGGGFDTGLLYHIAHIAHIARSRGLWGFSGLARQECERKWHLC